MTTFSAQWQVYFALITLNASKIECLLEVVCHPMNRPEVNLLLADYTLHGWALVELGPDAIEAGDVLARCFHWIGQKLFALGHVYNEHDGVKPSKDMGESTREEK